MTSPPNLLMDVARLFVDDHPFWSHLWGVSPNVYNSRRVEFDRRTARRAALAKTSYPAVTRPAAAAGHPPAPTHLLSFPTSWDAVTHPVRTYQRYAKALPQRLSIYVRDPVAGMTADFKDLRHHNRFADLVGRAAEDEIAQAPVMAARLVDYLVAGPQFPPSFTGPGSKAPQPFPRPLKFAPLAEQAMRPMLEDAALRPPTTPVEQAVDGLTRAATLLGDPSEMIEAAPRVGAYFGGLWQAGRDLRTGLLDGKTWDHSFGQLSPSAKSTLMSFWDRAAAGRTGRVEEAAAWGDHLAASTQGSTELEQADRAPVAGVIRLRAEPNSPADPIGPKLIPDENEHPEGSFSISDWTAYPPDGPRPGGPVRLIYDNEYSAARLLANKTNRRLRRTNPVYVDKHVHEIQPVKFGGDPVDPNNKVPLLPSEHDQYTIWWSQLQRDIEGGQR